MNRHQPVHIRRVPLLERPFSVRRAAQLLTYAAVLAAIVLITTRPAYADPAGTLGAFSAFDIADSGGIRVSQYELSVDTGGIGDLGRIWPAQQLLIGWDVYRWTVDLSAFILDWTLNMSWLSLITVPLQRVAEQLQTQLLQPVNLAGLMLVISACVGGIRVMTGKTGKGLWDLASAALIAAAVTGLLATPVLSGTGDPLTKARHLGVGIADMITTDKPLTTAEVTNPAPDQHASIGASLIDTMIRPAHGVLNYGTVIAGDHPCAGAYDDALKAGPYFDPSKNTTRDKMADCDQALGTYADQAVFASTAPLSVFITTALLVCGLITIACVLLFLAVLMLAWNLLKLVITSVIGIGPGDTRGPMIRNAAQVIVSLVYVVSGMVVLSIVSLLIRTAFALPVLPILRFILVDLVVIAGMVLVVQTWVAHRRGGQSWAERVMNRIGQSVPKPTVGSRVGSWLKGPVGGQASVYGDLNGRGGLGLPAGSGTPAGRSPYGVSAMMRPVTSSNAYQLARLGATAAAAAGTGGGAALLRGGTLLARGGAVAARGTAAAGMDVARGLASTGAATARGAAITGSAAAQAAARGAQHASSVHQAYKSTRAGNPVSTGSSFGDQLVDRGVRGRAWLDRAGQQAGRHVAAASTVMATSSLSRPEPPGPAQLETTEDTTHQHLRQAAEHQLRRPEPQDRPDPSKNPASTLNRAGDPAGHPRGGSPVIVQTTTAADRVLQRLHTHHAAATAAAPPISPTGQPVTAQPRAETSNTRRRLTSWAPKNSRRSGS